MGGIYGANRCLGLHNQAINKNMRSLRTIIIRTFLHCRVDVNVLIVNANSTFSRFFFIPRHNMLSGACPIATQGKPSISNSHVSYTKDLRSRDKCLNASMRLPDTSQTAQAVDNFSLSESDSHLLTH